MHKSTGDTHKFLFHILLYFPGSEERKEIVWRGKENTILLRY